MLEWLVTIGDTRKSAGRLEWTFDDLFRQNSLNTLLAVGRYSSVPNWMSGLGEIFLIL